MSKQDMSATEMTAEELAEQVRYDNDLIRATVVSKRTYEAWAATLSTADNSALASAEKVISRKLDMDAPKGLVQWRTFVTAVVAEYVKRTTTDAAETPAEIRAAADAEIIAEQSDRSKIKEDMLTLILSTVEGYSGTLHTGAVTMPELVALGVTRHMIAQAKHRGWVRSYGYPDEGTSVYGLYLTDEGIAERDRRRAPLPTETLSDARIDAYAKRHHTDASKMKAARDEVMLDDLDVNAQAELDGGLCLLGGYDTCSLECVGYVLMHPANFSADELAFARASWIIAMERYPSLPNLLISREAFPAVSAPAPLSESSLSQLTEFADAVEADRQAEIRVVVMVGRDGASQPIYRYRDQLSLPDYQQSMISAADRARVEASVSVSQAVTGALLADAQSWIDDAALDLAEEAIMLTEFDGPSQGSDRITEDQSDKTRVTRMKATVVIERRPRVKGFNRRKPSCTRRGW